MEPLIEAVDVSKVYETDAARRIALDHVSLAVDEGEFVAVMGRSGSGKSTLLNVLGSIDRSHDGSVRLGDVAYESCSDDELAQLRRRSVGFVFQAFNLIPVLSARENVAMPGVIDGRASEECAARARRLLADLRLGDRADHAPKELSGGEQQRVAIARALFCDPAVVLADEPTGNLDSASGQDVIEILREANRERGQTIVMVTHDPAAAAAASRVLLLDDGHIVDELDFDDHETTAARSRRLGRWLGGAQGTASAGRPRPLVAR